MVSGEVNRYSRGKINFLSMQSFYLLKLYHAHLQNQLLHKGLSYILERIQLYDGMMAVLLVYIVST